MSFSVNPSITLADKMKAAGSFTTGFDYLRIALSLSVACWHSLRIASGVVPDHVVLDIRIWQGPFHFLPAMIIPLFFCLSGFLVAGSLLRTPLHHFMALRVLRLVPALAVEIILSAVLLGLAFSALPWPDYISDPMFRRYFLNIVGDIHYYLPGVFLSNPEPRMINYQLWTIPYELKCYIALSLLAIFRLVTRRRAFVTCVVLGIAFLTTRDILSVAWTEQASDHVPGLSLVLCFLASVSLYLYRDVVPYSHRLGWLSGVLTALCLQFAALNYLVALPGAYFCVWIGLMTPPKIPFGDLSYGVYLFHYPIEQTVAHVFPAHRIWWQVILISLPLTLLCAFVSWNLIEQPILGRKRKLLALMDRALLAAKSRIVPRLVNRAPSWLPLRRFL